jgi:L-2-hydroxyglutarate oxidase LhgO
MYYTPETLKAKYCVRGNRLMKEYCREKGLTLNETGKVILANDKAEVEALYELKRRADLCGARAHLIDRKKLEELEPGATPGDEALFSPPVKLKSFSIPFFKGLKAPVGRGHQQSRYVLKSW